MMWLFPSNYLNSQNFVNMSAADFTDSSSQISVKTVKEKKYFQLNPGEANYCDENVHLNLKEDYRYRMEIVKVAKIFTPRSPLKDSG